MNCACNGNGEYKFHTPSYCGEVSHDEAFPPYPLEPKCQIIYGPRTNRVTVHVTLQLPGVATSCTPAQIEEWLRFSFGDNGLLHPSPISEESTGDPLIFEWEWTR